MKTLPRFSLCLAVAALLALSTGASADHTWGGYHWARTNYELPLQVVDSVTPEWQFEFDTALADWNVSSVINMSVAADDDGRRTRRRCRSVDGQMRVCNDSYGNNGWLGLASINIDSNGHIVKGTAQMNDTYASYWQIPGERLHVMCQEIGHVLGLGHTSEDGTSQQTCMDYSTDRESTHPNLHDYGLLADIYNHIDSYNSYAAAVSGDGGDGGNSGCTAPPGKGCNKNQGAEIPPMGVRVSRGPGFEIWAARGANDTMWIHHITLVPDEQHEH